jgi:hypothetical protein
MEQTGQCHCGSLRVIAAGEPDRVYLCHCKACQRRTGTAFHFGATYSKQRVRLDGERKIYERDADSGYRIRFHFCPSCGTTLYWEGDRHPAVCGVAVGAFETSAFPPPSDSIFEESDASVARSAAQHGPPSAGPTTCYMRAEPNRSISMNSILRSDLVTKSFRDNI